MLIDNVCIVVGVNAIAKTTKQYTICVLFIIYYLLDKGEEKTPL